MKMEVVRKKKEEKFEEQEVGNWSSVVISDVIDTGNLQA